jgi:uncharacterized protein (DUF885 family)
MEYDYHDYFSSIPSADALDEQHRFFFQQQELLKQFDARELTEAEQQDLAHIRYEVAFHLDRIALERQWVLAGRKIPQAGLYDLKDHERWYSHFIKKFCSTETTPEEVLAFGKKEVARVRQEMDQIRMAMGFRDQDSFIKHLQHDSFYITDKTKLLQVLAATDSTVRTHLPGFIGNAGVPPVHPMEWPDAGPFTPPGMYLNRNSTAYGKDVFQFNFYNRRFNRRAVAWLYMHEAIPGHHLQSSLRKDNALQELFLYPGNFEGWACYVEYLGKDFGLYRDPYSDYGRLEWDLVRSGRLVLDAGIHYLGWTREQALAWWKEHIPGQDEIAEREITRVTNWCGQALSYKIGAETIRQMKNEWVAAHPGQPLKEFYLWYLQAGMRPLAIMEAS